MIGAFNGFNVLLFRRLGFSADVCFSVLFNSACGLDDMTCLAHFFGAGEADSVAAEEYDETGWDTSVEFCEAAVIPTEGFLTALDVLRRR